MPTQFYNKDEAFCCPDCKSIAITKYGKDRNIQRYRCKTCKRTFKATIGKAIHGLHKKDKVAKYIEAISKGMSVRKSAKYAEISTRTAFIWRHKFLASLANANLNSDASETVALKVIIQEYSAKGRKKAAEPSTAPSKTLVALAGRRIDLTKLQPEHSVQNTKRILIKYYNDKFLLAIPNKTLTSALNKTESEQLLKKSLIKTYTEKIEKQEMKLLLWMVRFRGVATKYLQQYWNWYRVLQQETIFEARILCLTEHINTQRNNRLFQQLINT